MDVVVDNFDCHMGKMTKIMKKTLQAEKYPKVIIDIKRITLEDNRITRLKDGDNIVADANIIPISITHVACDRPILSALYEFHVIKHDIDC